MQFSPKPTAQFVERWGSTLQLEQFRLILTYSGINKQIGSSPLCSPKSGWSARAFVMIYTKQILPGMLQVSDSAWAELSPRLIA
jgi:hypothetical protein